MLQDKSLYTSFLSHTGRSVTVVSFKKSKWLNFVRNGLLLSFLFILFVSFSAFAQNRNMPSKKVLPKPGSDTTHILRDTIGTRIDTTGGRAAGSSYQKFKSVDTARRKSNGMDTIITYSAKDSAVFNISTKIMRLRGDAKVDFKDQKLEAEVIEIYFNQSLLQSYGVRDTGNVLRGFPKFTDKGESFVGEKILYNFKTRQGTISYGETEMGEGYYFGEKVKRISENELFVSQGRYTTCDKPHPHYYFGSPEMKVVAQDRVFLDPLILYVEDMPVFIIPFGLFFPNKTGRQSGLVVPSYFFSQNRGVSLENLGVYLALSDYYDTEVLTKFYSKGGFNIEDITRWKLLNSFDGHFRIGYGITRDNPDVPFNTNWNFELAHNQTLTPQTNITANMRFASQNYQRNVYNNLRDRIVQDISSNAAFSHSFDNGSSMSLSFERAQNIINNTYRQDFPILSYSLPTWNPLKSVVTSDNWLSTFSFGYSGNAAFTLFKDIRLDSIRRQADTVVRVDTNFAYSYKAKIVHNPSISVTPKFGYFNIQPSISLGWNSYFRKINRRVNLADSSVVTDTTHGFFNEVTASAGISVSTRVYGIAKPNIFGITAFRHVLQPVATISYTPDLSAPKYGFWDSYTSPVTGQKIQYSRFELDDGGIAPNHKSAMLSYALNNTFDIKIKQGDTVEDKTISILTFNLSGAYNFAADSLKFSDINFNISTPNFANLSLSANGSFTLYNWKQLPDPLTGKPAAYFTPVNEFLISKGLGLAKLKNFSLSLSTSFSSTGMALGTLEGQDTTQAKKKDSIGLGERFQQRLESDKYQPDYFGNNTPGWSKLSIPWNLSFGLQYSYNLQSTNVPLHSLNVSTNLRFNLTTTWDFSAALQYDVINKQFTYPIVNIHKDLHCWDLFFEWYPTGSYQGFYLRLNIKAPQLQDLKIEKRENPYY